MHNDDKMIELLPEEKLHRSDSEKTIPYTKNQLQRSDSAETEVEEEWSDSEIKIGSDELDESNESDENRFINGIIFGRRWVIKALLSKDKEFAKITIPVSRIFEHISRSYPKGKCSYHRGEVVSIPAITAILDLYFSETNLKAKEYYLEILQLLHNVTKDFRSNKDLLINQSCWIPLGNALWPPLWIAAYYADLVLIKLLLQTIIDLKSFKVDLQRALLITLYSNAAQIEFIEPVILFLCQTLLPLSNPEDRNNFTIFSILWLKKYVENFNLKSNYDPTYVMMALIKNGADFFQVTQSISRSQLKEIDKKEILLNKILFFRKNIKKELDNLQESLQPVQEGKINQAHLREKSFDIPLFNQISNGESIKQKKTRKRRAELDYLGPILPKRSHG